MTPDQHSQARSITIDGTLDGSGAGDHDLPYRFGRKPTSSHPFPFSTHQYARLLILCGRVQAGMAHSRGHESHVARSGHPVPTGQPPAR